VRPPCTLNPHGACNPDVSPFHSIDFQGKNFCLSAPICVCIVSLATRRTTGQYRVPHMTRKPAAWHHTVSVTPSSWSCTAHMVFSMS